MKRIVLIFTALCLLFISSCGCFDEKEPIAKGNELWESYFHQHEQNMLFKDKSIIFRKDRNAVHVRLTGCCGGIEIVFPNTAKKP